MGAAELRRSGRWKLYLPGSFDLCSRSRCEPRDLLTPIRAALDLHDDRERLDQPAGRRINSGSRAMRRAPSACLARVNAGLLIEAMGRHRTRRSKSPAETP
jgi:hypothetical protein